jgi:DHA1 family tetracycline resistance protein-like MFS transporter
VLPSIIEGFGVNPSWTGYTQAFYAVGMFIGGLFFGKLSDKYWRKKILSYTSIINLMSYLIMLLSVAFIVIDTGVITHIPLEQGAIPLNHLINIFHGFTPLFVLFLFARFIGWLGGAWFGVIQAYISDISTPLERTRNMGYMGAAFGMAFLIGPAIGGLLSTVTTIPVIIALCSLVILLNVISIFVFLEEPKKHAETAQVHLWDFHFSHTVILLLVLSFGSTLAFAAVQSMSTQFYADRFHFDATKIGLTMAMVGLISIIYQWFLVKYVRHYLDEMMMIRLAFLILTIWFIGFSLNTNPYLLFFWIALFPLGMW